jgi:hypothetical protein
MCTREHTHQHADDASPDRDAHQHAVPHGNADQHPDHSPRL